MHVSQLLPLFFQVSLFLVQFLSVFCVDVSLSFCLSRLVSSVFSSFSFLFLFELNIPVATYPREPSSLVSVFPSFVLRYLALSLPTFLNPSPFFTFPSHISISLPDTKYASCFHDLALIGALLFIICCSGSPVVLASRQASAHTHTHMQLGGERKALKEGQVKSVQIPCVGSWLYALFFKRFLTQGLVASTHVCCGSAIRVEEESKFGGCEACISM